MTIDFSGGYEVCLDADGGVCSPGNRGRYGHRRVCASGGLSVRADETEGVKILMREIDAELASVNYPGRRPT